MVYNNYYNRMVAIGIDLGTTYSCVGWWKDNRCEIIANDQGNRTTPSYVGFTSEERIIGDGAKNQASMNPENTVFAVVSILFVPSLLFVEALRCPKWEVGDGALLDMEKYEGRVAEGGCQSDRGHTCTKYVNSIGTYSKYVSLYTST